MQTGDVRCWDAPVGSVLKTFSKVSKLLKDVRELVPQQKDLESAR